MRVGPENLYSLKVHSLLPLWPNHWTTHITVAEAWSFLESTDLSAILMSKAERNGKYFVVLSKQADPWAMSMTLALPVYKGGIQNILNWEMKFKQAKVMS